MSTPATARRYPLPAAEAIPLELRERAQWVAWRWSGEDKLPVDIRTGELAKTNDASTWATFEKAYDYAREHGLRVGFVFTASDPFCGVDLDDIRSPDTGKIAMPDFERITHLDSYTEISPSGAGVKIIVRAHLDKGYPKKNNVEAYPAGRFFTITGEHLPGTPETIENRQAQVDALIAEVFGSNGSSQRVDTAAILAGVPEGSRDNELFRLACKLRHADVPQDMAERITLDAAANCNPPFPEKDALAKVATSAYRYPPSSGDTPQEVRKPSWPAPLKPEALYGLAGDIVRLVEEHTEADPAAILTNLLTMTGNAVGYRPHFGAEQDKHGMRLFVVQVGDTAKGRKGVAEGIARAVFNVAAPDWLSLSVTTGLSTGEGLIWGVRDAVTRTEPIKENGKATGETQDVLIDKGIADKRLLVIEPEFARTLRVMARDGNVLSAVMRQAWDTGNLRVLTKNTPAKATEAHISIIGHITKDELLHYLDSTEAFNGFANRFLWVCVRRSKILPEGGSLPLQELERTGMVLGQRIESGRGVGLMSRDPASRTIWHEVYAELSQGKPGLVGAVLGRAEAQVMRLASINALLDGSGIIRAEHLTAALAFWQYCEASAKYIFGNKLGKPVADTIFARLCQGEASQTELSTLFGRNYPASRLSQALEVLLKAGLVTSFQKETAGRPQTVWTLS